MTLSATTVFLLTWGGLLLLKAPLALLSALICGLLTFVPTIGPTVAAPAIRIGLTAIAAIDGVCAGVPAGASKPGSFLLTLLLRKTVNLLPTVA